MTQQSHSQVFSQEKWKSVVTQKLRCVFAVIPKSWNSNILQKANEVTNWHIRLMGNF